MSKENEKPVKLVRTAFEILSMQAEELLKMKAKNKNGKFLSPDEMQSFFDNTCAAKHHLDAAMNMLSTDEEE